MNRRTPATALLAVLVLVAIALLAPVSSAGANKALTINPPTFSPDDAGVPPGFGEKIFPIPEPVPTPALPSPSMHDDMRHLWMDHIVWSRIITMGVFSDLKGVDAYKERLVMNSYDMTNLLVPYFGKEGAYEFAGLFERHVTLASDVLDAYKSGYETLIRDTTYAWYLNADEIASLLCKINPAWDFAQMRALWRQHLDTVVDEALDYKMADYKGDVVCYDAAQDHVFVLADYLSGRDSDRD